MAHCDNSAYAFTSQKSVFADLVNIAFGTIGSVVRMSLKSSAAQHAHVLQAAGSLGTFTSTGISSR